MTNSTPAPDAVRPTLEARFPKLNDHLIRMASSGQTGSLSEWGDFINCIHEAAAPAPATATGGDAPYKRLTNYPDYISDAEGLEHIRSSLLKVEDWHDMPGNILNCNSLARLLDTIEMQRAQLAAALASQPQATGGAVEREVLIDLIDSDDAFTANVMDENRLWLARILADKILATQPAPSPGGWRTDFENAPTDGSVFLVGYDDETAKKAGVFANKDRVYEARWNETQATWSARNGFILHSDATHWQPLPAAPSIQKGGE